MAMSTGDSSGGPMSEINVTPLVDVMLVLLIIFMITAPLMSHRIRVELPHANPKAQEIDNHVTPVDIAIKADGTLYVDDLLASEAELKNKLSIAASQMPQPEIQIRAENALAWKNVNKVLTTAKASGMVHVAFMTTGKE